MVDRGFDAAVKRQLGARAWVTVGVHENQRGEGGERDQEKMMLIAEVNEYGSADGHTPARSYMRSAMDGNRDAIAELEERLGAAMLEGSITPEAALTELGQFGVGLVKQRILELDSPPLAESTIRRKGHDKPLIETGQLLGAITHELHGKVRPT